MCTVQFYCGYIISAAKQIVEKAHCDRVVSNYSHTGIFVNGLHIPPCIPSAYLYRQHRISAEVEADQFMNLLKKWYISLAVHFYRHS